MYDDYSNLCSIATGAYGIANIKEILGIIVLVLSILNILINAGIRVYHKIKNKKYDEIPNDISDTINQINDLKEEDKDE